MTTAKKILLGILALSPLPFIGLYIYSFFTIFEKIEHFENASVPSTDIMQNFGVLFAYIGIALVLVLVGMIIYILDIVKNKNFDEPNGSMKAVWVLIVVFTSSIGMLIYFFVEIIGRKVGEDYQTAPITHRTN